MKKENIYKLNTPTDLEEVLFANRHEIENWFKQQWAKQCPPFYCSVDLRNAGFKLAPVDTNLFPAGFNNLSEKSKHLAVSSINETIQKIQSGTKKVLLIPENHTRNLFYLENIATLRDVLTKANYEVRIGTLSENITDGQKLTTSSGKTLAYEQLKREGDFITTSDFKPCFIVLNHDLSGDIPDILKGLKQHIHPPLNLGWAYRLKSRHFEHYQNVTEEFGSKFSIDPWLLTPYFRRCGNINFQTREGIECVARESETLLADIERKYKEHNIKQDPFIVVKADAGTYGMSVMMIKDPDEIRNLNRKQRTKMAHAKGGNQVSKAIIQEGVYTFESIGEENSVAEPVIYMMGKQVLGGFYRIHKGKGQDENLNSPGMFFKPLPFGSESDIPCKYHEERYFAYSVTAKLALLAAADEIKELESGN